jgi:hypothetical protein
MDSTKINPIEFYHIVFSDDKPDVIMTSIGEEEYVFFTRGRRKDELWKKTKNGYRIISKEKLNEEFKFLLRKEKLLKIKEKI